MCRRHLLEMSKPVISQTSPYDFVMSMSNHLKHKNTQVDDSPRGCWRMTQKARDPLSLHSSPQSTRCLRRAASNSPHLVATPGARDYRKAEGHVGGVGQGGGVCMEHVNNIGEDGA